HLVDTNPLGLHFGAPVGHSLGRFLGGLDALIGELHQTNICRHDVPPLGSPRIGFRNEDKINLWLPKPSVKCGKSNSSKYERTSVPVRSVSRIKSKIPVF